MVASGALLALSAGGGPAVECVAAVVGGREFSEVAINPLCAEPADCCPYDSVTTVPDEVPVPRNVIRK